MPSAIRADRLSFTGAGNRPIVGPKRRGWQGSRVVQGALRIVLPGVANRHLLVEFKRPELTVGRAAESQAIMYADTLTGQLGIGLDILIVGGQVDSKLQAEYSGKRTKFLAYRAVIATARTQLEWLLRQLNEKP